MKSFRLLALSALILPVAAVFAQEAAKPAVPPAPAAPSEAALKREAALANRCILLVNAAELPAAEMEAVRAFAEQDLRVKVKAVEQAVAWAAMPEKLPGLLSDEVRLVVALGKGPADARIVTAPDSGWAMVNVTPLLALSKIREHMIKQQAMRGIGYALGVAVCLDRYCCMRTSQVLPDLKDAGENFCPITRRDYENLTIQHGLRLAMPANMKVRKAKPAAPPAK